MWVYGFPDTVSGNGDKGDQKRKRDGWAWQARGEDAYCRGRCFDWTKC